MILLTVLVNNKNAEDVIERMSKLACQPKWGKIQVTEHGTTMKKLFVIGSTDYRLVHDCVRMLKKDLIVHMEIS